MAEAQVDRIETAHFEDDGQVPNSVLPVILYRGAIAPDPRDPAEIELWKGRDPIARLIGRLREQGHLDDAGVQAIEREVMAAIEAAVAFAEKSPFPLPEQAADDVFAA